MCELVSVIVPIYNVERYLPKCIESIINQSYSNVEILLVNDGSPDGCGAICDKYAAKESRIKVFHIPNGGVAKARQLGVENSVGEFIVFVDPDDWLSVDAIDILYQNMDVEVDLVIGSFSRYENDNILSTKQYEHGLIPQDHYMKILIHDKELWAPWAKLYRRTLFLQDTFPVTKRCQDFLMNLDISCRVNKVKFIPQTVYNYNLFWFSGSPKESYEIFGLVVSKMIAILDKFGKMEEYEDDVNFIAFDYLVLSVINGFDIQANDDWVLLAKKYSKTASLNFRQRVFKYSFSSIALQRTIYFFYSSSLGRFIRKSKVKFTN